MKSDSELVAAADENFVVSFAKLAEHCPGGETRAVDGIFAFVTGLPVSFFNGCVVTEPVAPDALRSAVGWVRGQGVPHRVWIAERSLPRLVDVPAAIGLDGEPEPLPGMVLHPVPEPPAPGGGIEVDQVAGDGLAEFVRLGVEGGLPREVAERLFPASFTSDPDVRLYVGRLDGRPVGTAIAIRSESASGVYNVVTLPRARRRGVGAALTWAAVACGHAWGRDTIVLQSTAMGLSLYAAMGFRTVAPYTMFGTAA